MVAILSILFVLLLFGGLIFIEDPKGFKLVSKPAKSAPDLIIGSHHSLDLDLGNGGAFLTMARQSLEGPLTPTHHDQCRENFARRFHSDTSMIGFTMGSEPNPLRKARAPRPIDVPRLKKTLRELEDSLNAAPSTVYSTQYPNTVVVKVSPFWLQYITRRSLFTLFLRGLAVLGSIEAIFSRYSLARQTEPAIRWFLKGNTLPVDDDIGEGGGRGWVAAYAGKDDLDKRLVSPDINPKRLEEMRKTVSHADVVMGGGGGVSVELNGVQGIWHNNMIHTFQSVGTVQVNTNT